ncbi:MAG: hypothetical protein M1352_01430 [Patescibacteria group bacterium]|nr:hypothetical protein [Patescibacteria group bacterium]
MPSTSFDLSTLESLETSGVNKLGYLDVGRLVANLYVTLVIVSGIAAFLFLAMGGFQYISSGGDKVAVEAARNKITYAIMGLAIVVGAYAVGFVVQAVFGVSIVGGVLWPHP